MVRPLKGESVCSSYVCESSLGLGLCRCCYISARRFHPNLPLTNFLWLTVSAILTGIYILSGFRRTSVDPSSPATSDRSALAANQYLSYGFIRPSSPSFDLADEGSESGRRLARDIRQMDSHAKHDEHAADASDPLLNSETVREHTHYAATEDCLPMRNLGLVSKRLEVSQV